MKTLKIEIPKGFEVKSFDKKTGEIKFREAPNDITQRIKTIDEALEYHGLNKNSFLRGCCGLDVDEIAYRKIKLIVEALNEGWKPDWTNSSEYKYYPWFKMGGSSGSGFLFDGYDYWHTSSDCGYRLCFKSSELAKYAGKQFEGLYRDYFLM